MQQIHQPKWIQSVALFLTGLSLQFLVHFSSPIPTIAHSPDPTSESQCAALPAPLSPEEEGYARTAWQYFLNNYQSATGFTNSVGGYPSGSLWDMGNYLMALNAARWLNLIAQADFDSRLNQFLTTLSGLKLFDDTLPNKTYNAANGQMVDYGNQPVERGIGWSALDLGRMLTAFHVIRTCHPQYADWLKGIVGKWNLARSLSNGQLYGATVLSDGKTQLVQEGRLGYEEYAVRGYELWGFTAPKARSLQPMKFVDIYGVQIPVDSRDFQNSGANNYVVSESYILDGIEFGLQGELADYASRILEAQKRRYEATQQLTAVSEDNLDGAPYFLYNTVYANGVLWAAITDTNQPYSQFRSISTKAAFGWRYLFPTHDYAQKVFDAVKDLRSPDNGGFYAGLYEASKQPNQALTGNTNGLILEILYYKARGNRSLVNASVPDAVKPASIAPVGTAQSSCPAPSQPLSEIDRRRAQAAWQYFQTHVQASGLVNDRSDFKGTTLWGLGDYLSALHAARMLTVISASDFDQRVRQLLGTLSQLPLFAGELPNRSYDSWSLQPVDYGDNPTPEGTGWSALDIGRLLSALYNLKTCHSQYATAIDRLPLDWSYLRVIRDGALFNATIRRDNNGRTLTQIVPETRLGYEEYAARAFQLWGFEMDRAAVGGQYQTTQVEGIEVPVQRVRSSKPAIPDSHTVSNPFLLYGLEFGFDPQMRSLVQPLLKAQAERYRRTQVLTASATTLIERSPYVVHSTVVGQGEPWATLTTDGRDVPDLRIVSTAAAFAFSALFPDEPYTQTLLQSVADSFNSSQGYPEGLYEKTKQPVAVFTAETNSLILQSLLSRSIDRHPIVHGSLTLDSPWWQAITADNSERGLPKLSQQAVRLVTDASGTYWASSRDSSPTNSTSTPQAVPSAIVPTVQPSNPAPQSLKPQATQFPLRISESDQSAAKQAWKYFERNWNSQTRLVNAVDQLPWTTLWDQGSALLGIHAARQLELISAEQFNQRITTLLTTLQSLPIPATQLPNKAYSTNTAQMRQLDNIPDPKGTSGWSVLDVARFLVGLQVIKKHYPEYQGRIDRIVERWDLTKLIHNGWLSGGISSPSGIQVVQEGRLGYEQYAAQGLKLWNLEAIKALSQSPTTTVQVDGVPLQVDQRELKNSGASNYLTSDPYLLWGLELGWTDAAKAQVQNLLKVQAQRFQQTGIVTAVNEDSLDRPPYFLYYSVYVNGKTWQAIDVRGQAYPALRTLSTKAAFAWAALMPQNAYAKTLRNAVQDLADPDRGYFSGRYENSRLGKNASIDINTNAVILESLLYRARGNQPLVF